VKYNKLIPNQVLREGDRSNYDYDAYVDWAAVFGQVEYNLDKFDIFGTVTLTNTSYQRQGNMWNGRLSHFESKSLGLSEKRTFNTYTIKAGASFHPTNRHNFFANVGRFTRPPFFRNAFFDARYSNEYKNGLVVETITSGEVGYSYRSSLIKVNANAYYTIWKDRTTAFENDTDPEIIIPFAFNGLESLHKGIELDFVFNATSSLELNGFLSLGDWHWNKNAVLELDRGNGFISQDTLDIKGFPVGAVPQTTIGLGAHYTGIKDTYIGARWQYSDRISVRYSPDDVYEEFIDEALLKRVEDAGEKDKDAVNKAGRQLPKRESSKKSKTKSVEKKSRTFNKPLVKKGN
jgi:hypothetical protein